MHMIVNQHFENETIAADGFLFIGCSFVRCIVLTEAAAMAHRDCTFKQTAIIGPGGRTGAVPAGALSASAGPEHCEAQAGC